MITPERRHALTSESGGLRLRRVTGVLFLVSALAFTASATGLSATFDWPDILREPADVVLPSFAAGGSSLVWTWFATAWTYAILLVPILLLPAALGRRDDVALWVATFAGAISVMLALIGFLRWVFVVPPLARLYQDGDSATRTAIGVAWLAQHQFGGALLGEHLGQLLGIGWSVTLSIIVLRTRVLPRWLGVLGLVVSGRRPPLRPGAGRRVDPGAKGLPGDQRRPAGQRGRGSGGGLRHLAMGDQRAGTHLRDVPGHRPLRAQAGRRSRPALGLRGI